jgi:Lon protease-like protein
MNDPSPPEPAPWVELPSQAPVIILPDCNLLPHEMLPLFIFEPRYRTMLRDTLATTRLFCVGMRKPDMPPDSDGVFDHSTLGLIRASVLHDDGTFHLVLQGIRRVRFTGWSDIHPYRMARLGAVGTSVSNADRANHLCEQILTLLQQLERQEDGLPEPIHKAMEMVQNPDALSDMLTHTLITNPFTRQHLLETTDACERLDFLHRQLSGIVREQSSS